MKTLAIMTVCTICAISTVVSATVPDSLSIGKMQIIEKMADATTIDVICSSDSMKTFSKTVSLPKDFASIKEIQEAISKVKITISPSNPESEIILSADIKDAVGDVLFSAKQNFFLEKNYTEEGTVEYQPPSWVGNLYFWFAQGQIFFEGVQQAVFINSNGDEFDLMIEENLIYVGYHGSGTIKITTSDGQFWYDWNTGSRIDNLKTSFNNTAQFSDFWKYDVIDGNVYLVLYPEWEYVPWVEVTAPKSGIINLNISSYNGYQPNGVWLKSLEDLRDGVNRGAQKYFPGMTLNVKPGETIFLFFDFPDYVWGMESNKGGGKG